LKDLLENAGLSTLSGKGDILAGPLPAEDSAIIKINDETCLVQTVDFFTPIVDEPITQGRIAACNVTNDLYAKGATKVLGVLVIMGFPPETPDKIAVDLLKGFSGFLKELETQVVGGHTISNPWPILGGAATATMKIRDVVFKKGAKAEDDLILTKPLGVQPVMAAYRLMGDNKLSQRVLNKVPRKIIEGAIKKTVSMMTTSNKPVAETIHEVKVNAATDVTGFGLVGHASEVAEQSSLDLEIKSLPVVKGSLELSDILGYSLREGSTHETAGGMLLSVAPDSTERLLEALRIHGVTPYVIGNARKGSGKVRLSKDLQYVEV
jgi:selenide,water dikinase